MIISPAVSFVLFLVYEVDTLFSNLEYKDLYSLCTVDCSLLELEAQLLILMSAFLMSSNTVSISSSRPSVWMDGWSVSVSVSNPFPCSAAAFQWTQTGLVADVYQSVPASTVCLAGWLFNALMSPAAHGNRCGDTMHCVVNRWLWVVM